MEFWTKEEPRLSDQIGTAPSSNTENCLKNTIFFKLSIVHTILYIIMYYICIVIIRHIRIPLSTFRKLEI